MAKELYVGRISYEATEEDLRKLFSVSGTVTSIHLITDLKTGEFKGCGYVRMSTDAEAKDAIATLDGALLIDRSITVSIAKPQKMLAKGGGAPFRPKGPGKGAKGAPAQTGAKNPAAKAGATRKPR
ncbi:RNA recognition motif domain-containing protein [Geomesophilobacter sediminis]|uniref:RNA-binding protein n=1 Tax=Geomesophilobacter sediminis TaxID=2798584 RepID=A0A8J7JEJ5_9BACT|nr:RNA-binding protein [Geomesophilobacter sediminis]MBJ6725691.1 RNA-binding protein [Geomesophilobacter sediminis]